MRASPRPTVVEWSYDGRFVYLAMNARDRWERGIARWDRQSGQLQVLSRDMRFRTGIRVARDGGRDETAATRVAFGSVAAVPLRAPHAEGILSAGRVNAATVRAACDALGRDITPIDDVRSTARYRLHCARAILARALER